MAGFAKQSDREAAQGWGWSSETTVDQTLIRGLGTGLPCLRLGAVLGLEGGRRAHRLGHITSDGSSPPWPHPQHCAAGWVETGYDGATSRPMAHKKAAISRAIAATTTGGFLPAALRRR